MDLILESFGVRPSASGNHRRESGFLINPGDCARNQKTTSHTGILREFFSLYLPPKSKTIHPRHANVCMVNFFFNLRSDYACKLDAHTEEACGFLSLSDGVNCRGNFVQPSNCLPTEPLLASLPACLHTPPPPDDQTPGIPMMMRD